jgi:hypothetical protein
VSQLLDEHERAVELIPCLIRPSLSALRIDVSDVLELVATVASHGDVAYARSRPLTVASTSFGEGRPRSRLAQRGFIHRWFQRHAIEWIMCAHRSGSLLGLVSQLRRGRPGPAELLCMAGAPNRRAAAKAAAD